MTGGLIGTALGYVAGNGSGGKPSAPAALRTTSGLGEAGAPAAGADVGTPSWAEPGGEAGRVAVSAPVGTDTVPFHGPHRPG